MMDWAKGWQRLMQHGREIFRRHWQRALLIRDKLRFSEEAVHLVLAGAVGVVGGLTYWAYHGCNQLVQLIVLSQGGDLIQIAQSLAPWQRLLTPMLGGLVAGLVLVLGLRLMGNPGLSNLLEVVVAGDGRLSFRTGVL